MYLLFKVLGFVLSMLGLYKLYEIVNDFLNFLP